MPADPARGANTASSLNLPMQEQVAHARLLLTHPSLLGLFPNHTEGGEGSKRTFKETVHLMFSLSFVLVAPNEKMKQVLKKTIEEAKAIVSKVSAFSFLPSLSS